MTDSFIVGDAGGTGTQWRVVENGQIHQFETVGFNAYTHSIQTLKSNIEGTFGEMIEQSVPKYFYAAGVDTPEQRETVVKSLQSIFFHNVSVENDLVGVARSLCGKEQGNVCILGTGSNACFYNGIQVSEVGASLGYILGDEGSGADLGKRLLRGVFRKQVSTDVQNAFFEKYELSSHEAIQRIYEGTQPNHFLSTFSNFIFEHKNQKDVRRLVTEGFESFFDAFFPNHDNEFPFYFSGSIAWFFQDILREVSISKGFDIRKIVQSPIPGLVDYHRMYG